MVNKQRNVIIFYKHKVNKYKVIDQINVNKNVLCHLFYIKRKTLYKKNITEIHSKIVSMVTEKIMLLFF